MLPLIAKFEFSYQVELNGKAVNYNKPQSGTAAPCHVGCGLFVVIPNPLRKPLDLSPLAP